MNDSTNLSTTRRRVLGSIGIAAAGTIALQGASAETNQTTVGTWPQFQYDNANTGYAPGNTGPTGPVGSRLTVEVGHGFSTAPVVNGDLVYVADDDEEVLRAIDRTNGTERWTTEASISGAWPSVYGDTVYLPGRQVTALDAADGSERWTASIDGPAHGAVKTGETVVVSSHGGVIALDADNGRERWHSTAVTTWEEPPAVADNFTFAVDTSSGAVIALDLGGGGRQWIRRFEGPTAGAPTVVDDLVVVPGAESVYAFKRSTGTSVWETDLELAATVAAGHGLVYGVTGSEVVALSADGGTEQWTAAAATTNPPIVVGNTLYLAGDDGTVHALDASTGTNLWQASVGAELRTAFAAAGGELYAGTRDGRLLGLAPGAATPTATPSDSGTATAAPTEAEPESEPTPTETEEEDADGELLALLGGVGLLAAMVARGRTALGSEDDEAGE